jgi:putative restriction endonuclease
MRRNWTRDELLLAINLYCRTRFGRIHIRNPEIIELACVPGRTSSAVSWKLVNFAHIDPSLDRKGASNVSKLDRQVWAEFFGDWDTLVHESERLRTVYAERMPDPVADLDEPSPESRVGEEIERTVRTRVNQGFFRRMILASFNERCCVTGLSVPELLVASHIKPWAVDPRNRMNPQNGLCLNALHDRAFDRGLITLNDDCRVVVSGNVRSGSRDSAETQLLFRYEGQRIELPSRFLPDAAFLTYHRDTIFQVK